MTTYETVIVEREEGIATITLNRPDKLNAINGKMIQELHDVVRTLDADPTVRVAIMTGAGEKAFAAGADIAAMVNFGTTEAKAFSDAGQTMMAAFETAHFPTIAAVNGFALGGGCELAMCCDFLYGSDKAKLGQPEVNLAVIPGFGGTQRLARRVGIGRARELCYTGDILGAEEALRIGLLNAVVPAAELLGKVRAVAKKIASKAPTGVSQVKRVILRGEGLALNAATELESQCFAQLFGTPEQKDGMKTFLEASAKRG
jgi:enoyl-CoA hydratase